jgi:hypothetical protein
VGARSAKGWALPAARSTRTLAAGMVVFGALMLSTTAASAQPTGRGPIGDQESIVVDWCGADAPFRNDFYYEGRELGHVTGPDGTFRYSFTAHGEAIWTNLSTGRTLTGVWNTRNVDLHVTDNGDGTITEFWQGSGNLNEFGPDGKLVANFPGSFRVSTLIDYGGTLADPEDDTVISETFIRNEGHPATESECDLYRRLTI